MKVFRPLSISIVAVASALSLATCTTGRLFLENNLPVDIGQGSSKPARSYITTTWSEAYPSERFIDLTYEVKRGKPKPVASLPTDQDGLRIAKPGYYYETARSYCLRPSAHGPSSGDTGYLAAPLKGSAAPIVTDLVLLGERKGVPQDEVQSTIWAIETGDFDYALQDSTIGPLLSPRDRQWLQTRSAEKKALASANTVVQDNVPSGLEGALSAHQRFVDGFSSFASGAMSFDELVKLAVPSGGTPHQQGRAKWALLPQGYYVRAVPYAYSSTRLEYYVPRPVKWVYDRLGRPRSVTDETTGFRLDYTYYGESVYVTVPGYPSLKVYPFKSVKATLPASLNPKGKIAFIWRHRGFIVVGPLLPFLARHAENGRAFPAPLGMGPQVLLAQSDSSGSDVGQAASDIGTGELKNAVGGFKDGLPNSDWGPIREMDNEATLKSGEGTFNNLDLNRKTVGTGAELTLDAVGLAHEIAAYDDLTAPNVSEVDRMRAGQDLINGLPDAVEFGGAVKDLVAGAESEGGPSPFAIPLAVAGAMIGKVTSLWNEASAALAGLLGHGKGKGKGHGKKGNVVIFLPHRNNIQSVAAVPKLKQFGAP